MPFQKKPSAPLEGKAVGENAKDASLKLKAPELKGRVLGRTNIGAGRAKNQDAASAYVVRGAAAPKIVLSVADGLGCYLHSEHSSYAAVTRIPRLLSEGLKLAEAFRTLHRELIAGNPYAAVSRRFQPPAPQPAERSPDDKGSTTCVTALLEGSCLTVANVGDSRAYLIREGQIVYRTRDQSLMELIFSEFPEKRATTDLSRHPWRGVLLNSLGSPEDNFQFEEKGRKTINESGYPWIDMLDLKEGDALFMATDGAFNNLDEGEMIALIGRTKWEKLEGALNSLLQKAVTSKKTSKGTPATMDNYTFLVYRHGKL